MPLIYLQCMYLYIYICYMYGYVQYIIYMYMYMYDLYSFADTRRSLPHMHDGLLGTIWTNPFFIHVCIRLVFMKMMLGFIKQSNFWNSKNSKSAEGQGTTWWFIWAVLARKKERCMTSYDPIPRWLSDHSKRSGRTVWTCGFCSYVCSGTVAARGCFKMSYFINLAGRPHAAAIKMKWQRAMQRQ